MNARPIRIANVSGFYGDRFEAPAEMMSTGTPIDVLTGDYLAELTMLILWKARRRDPSKGYASTFVDQAHDIMAPCLDRGVRIVTNAGGLNPHGLARALRELANTLGLKPRIAVVEGDDVLDQLPALQAAGERLAHLDTGRSFSDADVRPVTANAYLGGFGIARALTAGADIVVAPRVTDAALVSGPASWWHGWTSTDLDELAGAVVAGHLIECGTQVTGGNYAFAHREVADHRFPGYPIAEVASDGSSTITKPDGTGGAVTVGTVTAQALYEIAEPAYANPDVVARFDTIHLEQVGPDRVRVAGACGESPTGRLKVAINYVGGWRNTMTLVLTGMDLEYKRERAMTMLGEVLGGWDQFTNVDARTLTAASHTELRITVKGVDREAVGRRFSNGVTQLVLAGYAGALTTSPPSPAAEYGVYWPTLVPADAVEHSVLLPDGDRVSIPAPVACAAEPITPLPILRAAWDSGAPTELAPLGLVCGARSGDKGGNANVGVWTTSSEGFEWLADTLTVDRLRELLPETNDLEVRRFELSNIRALNFVVVGLLGEGVASSTSPDPQAKALGERLRAQIVPVPTSLLDRASSGRN